MARAQAAGKAHFMTLFVEFFKQGAAGPESTSTPRPTYVPTSNPYPTSTPTIAKKTNAGAIAGGVSGAVVGLALLGVLVFFLLRRRPASSLPTAFDYDPTMAQQTPAGLGDSPYPSSPAAPGPSSIPGFPQPNPATHPNKVRTNTHNTTVTSMSGRPPQYSEILGAS